VDRESFRITGRESCDGWAGDPLVKKKGVLEVGAQGFYQVGWQWILRLN
jgi:hypothetical protein